MKSPLELLKESDGVMNLDSNVLYKKDEYEIINTRHGAERIDQRSELDKDQLKTLFDRIVEKAKKLGREVQANILFYSKSLRQGIVTAFDRVKHAIKIITFLPRSKHFAKPGTSEIVVEGVTYSNLLIIEID
jgi:hypothetical protein